MNKLLNKKGFSLIQLTVLLVVLGAGVVAMTNFMQRNRTVDMRAANLQQIELADRALREYIKTYRTLPGSTIAGTQSFVNLPTNMPVLDTVLGRNIMYIGANFPGGLCASTGVGLTMSYCTGDPGTNAACTGAISTSTNISYVIVHPGADERFSTIMNAAAPNVRVFTAFNYAGNILVNGANVGVNNLSDDDIVYYLTVGEAYVLTGCTTVSSDNVPEIMLPTLPQIIKSKFPANYRQSSTLPAGYFAEIPVNFNGATLNRCCIGVRTDVNLNVQSNCTVNITADGTCTAAPGNWTNIGQANPYIQIATDNVTAAPTGTTYFSLYLHGTVNGVVYNVAKTGISLNISN